MLPSTEAVAVGDCLFNVAGPFRQSSPGLDSRERSRLLGLADERLAFAETGLREASPATTALLTLAVLQRREIALAAKDVTLLDRSPPPWIALQRLWTAWRCRRRTLAGR